MRWSFNSYVLLKVYWLSLSLRLSVCLSRLTSTSMCLPVSAARSKKTETSTSRSRRRTLYRCKKADEWAAYVRKAIALDSLELAWTCGLCSGVKMASFAARQSTLKWAQGCDSCGAGVWIWMLHYMLLRVDEVSQIKFLPKMIDYYQICMKINQEAIDI